MSKCQISDFGMLIECAYGFVSDCKHYYGYTQFNKEMYVIHSVKSNATSQWQGVVVVNVTRNINAYNFLRLYSLKLLAILIKQMCKTSSVLIIILARKF